MQGASQLTPRLYSILQINVANELTMAHHNLTLSQDGATRYIDLLDTIVALDIFM